MGAAIGQILAAAVGVAISPVPIIALILMLFSNHAARNSLSFLVGWLVGLTAAGMIVLSLNLQSSGGESDSSGVAKIVIGVVFLVLGLRQWRTRPHHGEEPETPAWMAAIDEFSAVKSCGLGILLSAINPKNLGLTIAAAMSISGAGLSGGEEVGVMLIFVLIASLTIIVPVVAFFLAGDRAEGTLDSMKVWLIANNHTVMTVLFVILGAKLLGDGISISS
jgi:threonine/homoserine/homoserine lactone efflux protein